MKTYQNLYSQITSFDNLLRASRNAQKGKRYQDNVVQFNFQLEDELLALRQELEERTYRPGPYRSFMILEPKERMISAAPYRDRVVHHALCNITSPLFERTFIHDSYANRKGKGVHAAILRYQQYARRYPYVLKCDIRKFFPSIAHELLKQEIRWKIACPDTLWLIDMIIDNSNPQEKHIVYFPGDDLFTPYQIKRGLPIGNLTSQWWANVYLNRFDHYVKEVLRVPGYIRYVDDFVAFAPEKMQLHELRKKMTDYLASLRLILHPDKTQIYQVKDGVPFLGFKVYPEYKVVKKQSIRRYKRFLRKKLKMRAERKLSPDELEAGLNSWLGHIRFGQNLRLENQIYRYLWSRGVNLFRHPSGSWRVLER
ncbi:MAG: RNA-dependent DNA polymerase [Lewinellaceae bacterium]|nr:RNA-dependent DNA polymerase [Lewinellaceae bacterium]